MADFHFSAGQISRSKGQSAVSAAAYRAGEKLHDDYRSRVCDYAKKTGIVMSDILLPSHVPKEFSSDREYLWNSVEKAERHPKAQLAYTFDFALQNEFSMEENIAIAKEFIQENFVDRGMIADYAVHLSEPKDGCAPNPHVHVMCPIRPMEPGGVWGAKQHRVYRLDESGNRVQGADGKDLFDARPTTDWGTPETLEHWRSAWAKINNEHFAAHGLDVRIDNRSYERQGIDRIPTVHEGPRVREMERKGIRTEKGERNRWIRSLNHMIKTLGEKLSALRDWITELNKALHEKPEPSVIELLRDYYDQRDLSAWSRTAKLNNIKEFSGLIAYLEEHKISTMEGLEAHIAQVNETGKPVQQQFAQIRNRLRSLDGIEKAAGRYEQTKPVYNEWYGSFFKKAKAKYAEEHKKELNTFYAARKQLQNDHFLDERGSFDAAKLNREREQLIQMMEAFRAEHRPLGEQVDTLTKIRKAISSVQNADTRSEEKELPPVLKNAQKENGAPQPTKSRKSDYSIE